MANYRIGEHYDKGFVQPSKRTGWVPVDEGRNTGKVQRYPRMSS